MDNYYLKARLANSYGHHRQATGGNISFRSDGLSAIVYGGSTQSRETGYAADVFASPIGSSGSRSSEHGDLTDREVAAIPEPTSLLLLGLGLLGCAVARRRK